MASASNAWIPGTRAILHPRLPVAAASPTSSAQETHEYLTALNDHPGAPRTCRKQIAYIDDWRRANWKQKDWPDHLEFGTCALINHDGHASHGIHRLVYMNRPAEAWTGTAGPSSKTRQADLYIAVTHTNTQKLTSSSHRIQPPTIHHVSTRR